MNKLQTDHNRNIGSYSSTLQRRTLGCSYDLPEKTPKKEKKWSLSNIFRRKKKEDSDSSSGDDFHKTKFLRRKKKSENNRKKPKLPSVPFDHVVASSSNSLMYGKYHHKEDAVVMSDPTEGFSNQTSHKIPSFDANKNLSSIDSISQSGSVERIRKNRRELTKARAEARRNSSQNNTSSEDESQQSNEISNDKQFNKKSRSARTDRYLKRHSQDCENPHNYLRISKSDLGNSPSWRCSIDSNKSANRGQSITAAIGAKHKLSFTSLNSNNSNISGLSTIPPSHGPNSKCQSSDAISKPSHKPAYDYSCLKKLNGFAPNLRSISCDENIHRMPQRMIHPVTRPKRGFRNLSLIDTAQFNSTRHPPPPPPRDPNRTSYSSDISRTNSLYFDDVPLKNCKLNSRRAYNCWSTSENHLSQSKLPARNEVVQPSLIRRENQKVAEDFNYFTDKNPRSRKPIFIKSGAQVANKPDETKEISGSHNAINFWKEMDRQTSTNPTITKTNNPQMFSSHSNVQTEIYLPNDVQYLDKNKSDADPQMDKNQRLSGDAESREEIKRKSSNLEEALNELESIYNSLKLGDEELLDRAEQKEEEIQSKKCPLNFNNAFRGALSDSSFSYEPFDTVDSQKRKRFSKRNHKSDAQFDDMAFRKLNKHRANTIGDPQSVVSQVSYLMRSPIFSGSLSQDQSDHTADEADATLDDVVYRSVKHANNSLKVQEPQPLFGIPLGPITPAANSDYLHAKSEVFCKPSFKHKKIPDIVKDDLAFRNLRKDSNKGPSLPPLLKGDFEARSRYPNRKPQRSLSANISNITNNFVKDYNEDIDSSLKALTDIADAMESARHVLKEKENKISATRKAFLSDTDAIFPTSRPRKENILRGTSPNVQNTDTYLRFRDNLSAKPPRGLTPERIRSPREPILQLNDKKSANSESTSSSLDDLLNALAEEAKETKREFEQLQRRPEDFSKEEKFPCTSIRDEFEVNEMKKEFEQLQRRPEDFSKEETFTCTSIRDKFEANETKREFEQLQRRPEDFSKEETFPCTSIRDKLEATETEREFEQLERRPEDFYDGKTSPCTSIHDKSEAKETRREFEQLQRRPKDFSEEETCTSIRDKLMSVIDSSDFIAALKSAEEEEVKSITETGAPEESATLVVSRFETKDAKDIESEHDYENLVSDNEDRLDKVTSSIFKDETPRVLSPFEERKAELLSNFQELKEPLTSARVQNSKKLYHPEDPLEQTMNVDGSSTESNDYENCGVTGERVCASAVKEALPKQCAFSLNTNSASALISSCETVTKPSSNLSEPESRSRNGYQNNNLHLLDSLKSPKLVLETSNQNREYNRAIVEDIPTTSRDAEMMNRCMFDNLEDEQKLTPWYRDPATVALACSYSVACVHQSLSVDLFAIFSILLAILSFVAAMFL